MNENLSCRLAHIKDLKRLVEINVGREKQFKKENQHLLQKLIKEKQILVCVLDKKIIGLLYWQKEFMGKPYYFLQQITVDKEFRKKGYGFFLLQTFLEAAKKKGIKKIFGIIHNDNFASLQLSLKAGALICGTIEGLGDRYKKDERVIIRFEL